jgi:hypothetical protein
MSEVATKSDINRLEHELVSLKSLILGLAARLERKTKTKMEVMEDDLDWSDPTPEELMLMASRVFNVTSEWSPDDDNIAHPDVIKPVDWSGYAQNSKH